MNHHLGRDRALRGGALGYVDPAHADGKRRIYRAAKRCQEYSSSCLGHPDNDPIIGECEPPVKRAGACKEVDKCVRLDWRDPDVYGGHGDLASVLTTVCTSLY